MRFFLAGLNHKTAPVEVREKVAFDEAGLADALAHLRKHPGMHEGMILSTCNRVEVAVTADEGADAERAVEEFISESRRIERAWVTPYLYRHNGEDAIRHMFRVASSLDSMVIGEPQILGQLKSAYAVAKECGSVHGDLDLVMTRAFNVAKRIRTETEIGESAVSVSYAAVELAREIFGQLDGKRVLVLGAGKMALGAARHLLRSGAKDILVTNRTIARAEELAQEVRGRVVPYERFLDSLPETDIVLASSGAPLYILTRQEIRTVMKSRRNRPMFLIDIAVPRNIEPEVNELDNVFLYDIDDLGKVVEANRQGRLDIASRAEEIVREEVERMIVRLRTKEVAPTIVRLQEQLELWRKGEIERHRSKMGGMTPQQEEALEAITRGLVNKIAHGPISELRKSAASAASEVVADSVRKLFRIGDGD